MATVLITGATGFLGGYAVRELLAAGYAVRGFGRDAAKAARLENECGIKVHLGDLSNAAAVSDALAGADYCIHSGALSSVWGCWDDFYRANVLGTQNVLSGCLKHGIRRLVFVSSPSIYAAPREQLDIREEDAPADNRLNHYIRSKILAERSVRSGGVPSVIIRPRGLFGVGDTSIIPRLLARNRSTGIPLVNGGRHLTDLTCVENAAYALRLALESEAAAGQTYNITNGEPQPFADLLARFFQAAGQNMRTRAVSRRGLWIAANVLESAFRLLNIGKEPPLTRYTACLLTYGQTLNINKARRELGYKTRISIAQGIEHYVRHCPLD